MGRRLREKVGKRFHEDGSRNPVIYSSFLVWLEGNVYSRYLPWLLYTYNFASLCLFGGVTREELRSLAFTFAAGDRNDSP